MKESAAASPQTIRTHKAIQHAFLQLMKRKKFEEITVQDILDETPVSRGTFYKHFADKYQIAEEMQEQYFELQSQVIRKMHKASNPEYSGIVQGAVKGHEDMIEALMKIRTDRVDIRKMIGQQLKAAYLAGDPTPHPEVEASLYAAIMTEYQMQSFKSDSSIQGDPEYFNDVMIEVFMRIMKWSDREDIRRYLRRRLTA